MRTQSWLSILVLCAGVSACSSSASTSAPTPSSNPTPLVTPSANADGRTAGLDGTTFAVSSQGAVTVYAEDGTLLSESTCDGINYSKAVALMTDAKAAILAGHMGTLRKLALTHNTLSEAEIHLAMTPAMRARFQHVDPRELFCKNGEFTVGNGELWGGIGAGDSYGLLRVNPSV